MFWRRMMPLRQVADDSALSILSLNVFRGCLRPCVSNLLYDVEYDTAMIDMQKSTRITGELNWIYDMIQ